MNRRIVGFVQARTGSQRLPNKVMADILGRPMVWHVWHRMQSASCLDEVVICTSKASRPLIEFAQREGIPYHAGSERDLISRYLETANQFKADIIVRVTADCPLVDPQCVDEVVRAYRDVPAADYVSNSRPVATYPHGLDVELIPTSVLMRLSEEVNDPFRREWFTPNFFENPDRYRLVNVKAEKDWSSYRLTVDYQEDLELVRWVYQNLTPEDPGRVFGWKEILKLFEQYPERARKTRNRDEEYHKEREKAKELPRVG